ncbi:MAG: trehalose-6-phosphate synthase, partial [Micromonosporaceae bacterium]|nr:trehalose-6-phosphate synthase [Micromonosporaceae bacterium]
VHYLHQSYSRSELAALYSAADVMMVTPLRDGMNLVAKEYVAARVDQRGTLVLSEFAGAAADLRQAFLVNPHDLDGLKETLLQAIRAEPADVTRRMRSMRRYLRTHDVDHWARSFLSSLGATDAAGALDPARSDAQSAGSDVGSADPRASLESSE